MLFLYGVYAGHSNGTARLRWVRAPLSQELTQRVHTIAHRVGRFLERRGLLERDAESRYLAGDAVDDDPVNSLLGHSFHHQFDWFMDYSSSSSRSLRSTSSGSAVMGR
jgi:hypothetical protein